MSYDHSGLANAAMRLLRSAPGLSESALCSELRVDRHTLARALRGVGASFRTLRQSAITDAALEALEREPGSSVAEIGYRLGFSSGSAFCRFMRRRAGASPTQLRKQQTANSKQQTANMRRRGARPGLITIGMRNGGGAAQH